MHRRSTQNRTPFELQPRRQQKAAYIDVKNRIRRAASVLGGKFVTHYLHGKNGWLDACFLGRKADFVVLCTNTMHKVAPAIESAVTIPLLHIADPTAAAIRNAGLSRIGLLGTRFTMEQDFYRGRLVEQHGIDVLTPEAGDREVVHRVIYEELCLGRIEESSRQAYRDVMQRLVERGAQGIILGCTEISMLVGEQDASVPLYDTTAIHAAAAADLALAAVVESATPQAI